jgi:hypothetical protein
MRRTSLVVAEWADVYLRLWVREDRVACHGAVQIRMGEAGSQVVLLIVAEALVGLLVKAEHLL